MRPPAPGPEQPRVRGGKGEDARKITDWWEQPRIRGEKGTVSIQRLALGTTPQTRGKSVFVPFWGDEPGEQPRESGEKHLCSGAGSDAGSNPAHAGKMSKISPGPGQGQEQPRIRGEYSAWLFAVFSRRGTTPHKRGKERRRRGREHSLRINPARAGKSTLCVCAPLPGNNPASAGKRGPRRRLCSGEDQPRIRGEKSDWPQTLSLHRDQPRIRGESRGRAGALPLPPGTTPRERGKRVQSCET